MPTKIPARPSTATIEQEARITPLCSGNQTWVYAIAWQRAYISTPKRRPSRSAPGAAFACSHCETGVAHHDARRHATRHAGQITIGVRVMA
jgi:hypothetical protein